MSGVRQRLAPTGRQGKESVASARPRPCTSGRMYGGVGTRCGRPPKKVERGGSFGLGAARSGSSSSEGGGSVGPTASSDAYSHVNVMSNSDLPKLVSFFRQASPYIGQHFSKTFVLMVPGYIIEGKNDVLDSVLQDVALLQNLGVRLCIVLGATASIDKVLRQMGEETEFVRGYRVTSEVALQAARQAAGAMRIDIEAKLSKFIPAGSVRRHGYNQRRDSWRSRDSANGHGSNGQLKPPVQVVSGNFVMAKHKGVVDGVNFEYTGEVRNVWADAILQHMEQNQIVLVDNLGYTERGQVLNCSSFDIARKVSKALMADKLIVYHGEQVAALNLPAWIGLSDDKYSWIPGTAGTDASNGTSETCANASLANTLRGGDIHADPNVLELSLALQVCKEGVPRTHLINAYSDGALFLELYTRDGLGTMVSKDLYEGMRPATLSDLEQLKGLLAPLERVGTLITRSLDEIRADVEDFTVIERERKLIGCSLLKKLDKDVGEISAFVVQEEFRTEHRGDALLDFVEQRARNSGLKTLVLLTTRTGDWFDARGFENKGPAHSAREILPKERLCLVDPQRESMLFVKQLETGVVGPPGSRIGY
ncbi:amino-acid acetyltransferase [Chloropicon primus]|uniref:amino-acid N-acetyltransferase n=2 Tax=Chloropicon primus TaxID=1764295 RepID=A0A5B8MPP6_9CHLO|nr:amino-acid acetyltransferase [Chloropicon primus]UPR00466.1 amino-acid acetyltransferase [Chloropicon primus]|eukprot:QDZ21252.1 amino-acid acetyltransferase [Chloropicon primus]